ncbi:hypothetical protein MUG87_01385 [Ectobacillus sp. JY-23]|uniref:nuclear transport factor 2 family protein n=1 Tax=Ectobacillus sp. JY-23 TaxID=2933872 RepID=UPI001FF658AB|nr:hypothetical protein [Ectobacillus sp. JY-23]UOY92828.1 hypothetical protein MUG87_01385 [Ectobacillus sp. JY-23]
MQLETVKRFFELSEQFSTSPEDYKPLLHPDIEQTEFPNWITDRVVVSNWDMLLQRMPAGKKLLMQQKYDIQGVIESGDVVVTEVIWTAEVATDVGVFRMGQKLKAYFCCVFEFKNGKIFRQRNYDCFERF